MMHYTNTNNPIDFPKPKLQRLKGDLLLFAEAGMFDVIVQGCNCFCTMGSGIARQIREQYPDAYEADCETIPGDYNKLGTYTEAYVSDEEDDRNKFLIINAYTQFGFNKRGESNDLFEYISFELVLQKLVYNFGTKRFGLPYIGMGLAGGDKQRIMAMIEDFANKVSAKGGSVTLVEFV